MAIKNTLRNEIDRKEWEMMTPCEVSTAAGSHTICDPSGEDRGTMFVANASSILRYDHKHDAWQFLPASGAGGTFGAGSCGAYHPMGARGTCRATGTTTTVLTSLNIPWQLNFKIRFIGGTNAGLERTIVGNTIGVNATLTLDTPLPTATTTTTQFVILSGSFYFFNAGAKDLRVWDRATNIWSAKSVANLPATWGTEGQLIATYMTSSNGFAQGSATGGTTTTMINTAKAWTINNWANYQVRFTSGANAGQVRVITSNTANTLTLSVALPSAVASGDSYVLEGNEDLLYLFGNGAVDVYTYSISGNNWALYAPSVARAGGAPGAGMSADWVFDVGDPVWSAEPTVLNGRYIYSFRGGGSPLLHRLDLVTKAWETITYMPQAESITAGSGTDISKGYIYLNRENTGRVFRFNIIENKLVPWSKCPYPSSTAVVGDKLWSKVFVEQSGDTVEWIYMLLHTLPVLMRCMVIKD